MRCISFFRETLSSTFLLFCFVLYLFFFIYSFISDVFFSWITCCAYACINLRLEFSLYQRFFNNLPTLPHVPTASKASLFMLASEHPSCTRGPWRIVLPFFATSTTTFSDLRAVQVLLAICLWCPTIIFMIKIKFWSRKKEAYKDKNITTWLYHRSRTLYQNDLFAAYVS